LGFKRNKVAYRDFLSFPYGFIVNIIWGCQTQTLRFSARPMVVKLTRLMSDVVVTPRRLGSGIVVRIKRLEYGMVVRIKRLESVVVAKTRRVGLTWLSDPGA
jgi:hypothetical protein